MGLSGLTRRGPFGLVRVHGVSMLPALRDGDRVLASHGDVPGVGAVVVASLPDGTVVVKRVHERRPDGWWLLSDNAAVGLGDSRAWGAIPDDQVIAVVIARVWPRPGRIPAKQD